MSVLGITAISIVVILLAVIIATQLAGAHAAARLPRKGKLTQVKGGCIHWIDEGDGPPIVMIHGLGGNLHNFTYALTQELSDRFRVIAIDRPGCGWSERNGIEQATLPEQARMIAEFIENERLGKPLIVGHSLGGAVAETLALNHPGEVGGLALLCPLTNDVDQVPAAFKGIDVPVPWLVPILGHTLAGALSLVMEKRIFGEIFAPEPVPPDFLTRGGGILGRRPAGFIAAAQDLQQSRASVSQILGREAELDLPIGVLFGVADNILDPGLHGRDFAAQTSGVYLELPRRGHMIPITAPTDCADFIRKIAEEVFAPADVSGAGSAKHH